MSAPYTGYINVLDIVILLLYLYKYNSLFIIATDIMIYWLLEYKLTIPVSISFLHWIYQWFGYTGTFSMPIRYLTMKSYCKGGFVISMHQWSCNIAISWFVSWVPKEKDFRVAKIGIKQMGPFCRVDIQYNRHN